MVLFSGKISAFFFLALSLLAPIFVAAKDTGGGYITIINATPYSWTRIDMNKNKVKGYIPANYPELQNDWDWPQTIGSGESKISFYRWDEGARNQDLRDSGGEAWVTYKIEGTNNSASFKIRVSRDDKMVYAEFLEELESLGNPKNSIIRVGYNENDSPRFYPGQSFVLAGSEGSFTSTNPPVAWMQASLDKIGNRTLRELVLPATHNSGMSKLTAKRGGEENMDVTQSLDIYEQLKRGVRILDIRPSFWEDPTAHTLSGWWHGIAPEPYMDYPGAQVRCGNFRLDNDGYTIGGAGLPIEDVVRQVNQFNRDYPGELIFIRIRFLDTIFKDTEPKMHHLTWWLQQIENPGTIWLPDEGEGSDLGKFQLRSLIHEGGASAVYFMMPTMWGRLYNNISPRIENGNDDGRIVTFDLDSQFWWARGYKFYTDSKDTIENLIKKSVPRGPFDLNVTKVPGITVPPEQVQKVPYNIGQRTITNSTIGKLYEGFLQQYHFDWHNKYDEYYEWESMSNYQGVQLREYRQSPYDEPYTLKWIVEQVGYESHFEIGDPQPDHWIVNKARIANARLYDWLWRESTPASYPNAIEVNNIEDSQIAALAMAIMWYHGGKPELFNGVQGIGSSNKTDEEIQATMRREAEVSGDIDLYMAVRQQTEQDAWDEIVGKKGIPNKQPFWVEFGSNPDWLWLTWRVNVCSQDGKVCEADD